MIRFKTTILINQTKLILRHRKLRYRITIKRIRRSRIITPIKTRQQMRSIRKQTIMIFKLRYRKCSIHKRTWLGIRHNYERLWRPTYFIFTIIFLLCTEWCCCWAAETDPAGVFPVCGIYWLLALDISATWLD